MFIKLHLVAIQRCPILCKCHGCSEYEWSFGCRLLSWWSWRPKRSLRGQSPGPCRFARAWFRNRGSLHSKVFMVWTRGAAYLFSSNQLSTLVLASRGSPKLLGRDEVTQYIGLSVVRMLLVSFLFLRSLYSCMMPKLRLAWAEAKACK